MIDALAQIAVLAFVVSPAALCWVGNDNWPSGGT